MTQGTSNESGEQGSYRTQKARALNQRESRRRHRQVALFIDSRNVGGRSDARRKVSRRRDRPKGLLRLAGGPRKRFGRTKPVVSSRLTQNGSEASSSPPSMTTTSTGKPLAVPILPPTGQASGYKITALPSSFRIPHSAETEKCFGQVLYALRP